jgi:hypothetical protein
MELAEQLDPEEWRVGGSDLHENAFQLQRHASATCFHVGGELNPGALGHVCATTSLNQLSEGGTRRLRATERGGPVTGLCARSTLQFYA